MDAYQIIERYYANQPDLKAILLTHSRQVKDRAIAIAKAHPELQAAPAFIEEAALLHDIGIYLCNAQSIHCFGTEPYICHGRLGAELLRSLSLPQHARVAERHTGAGITKDDIISQGLPLPLNDYLPETVEEKIICYADKFYSKTRLGEEKTLEQAVRSLSKFGSAGVERFLQWHQLFE